MTSFERLFYAVTACALWAVVISDLVELPGAQAQAQSVRPADRFMSELLYEIAAKAGRGEALGDLKGYDELEARLQGILSRVVQSMPQSDGGVSRQEIRSALTSCRLIGTISRQAGHLDARLSC